MRTSSTTPTQNKFSARVSKLFEEEDHQPLTQPIVEPPKSKYHQLYRKEAPKLFYTTEYMVQLMSKP
jgi:U5 small nuclear ribonucleoprotein component